MPGGAWRKKGHFDICWKSRTINMQQPKTMPTGKLGNDDWTKTTCILMWNPYALE